jgi:hypothetical protein
MDRADALARHRAEMTRRGACAAALLLATCDARGGRPLTVEDASVVEDHGCQVEAWIDRSREATTGWIVPACNFFWNTEWQAGFARSREGQTRFSDAYVQAKTLLREVKDDAWGFATVVGATRHPLNAVHRGYDNPYALAVLTVPVGKAPTLLHGQVGWLHDREKSRDVALWGIAAESPVHPSLALLGEVFGENGNRPFWRVASRWTAIPNRLDVDLSFLSRAGASTAERFVSVGVTWQTGRLVP